MDTILPSKDTIWQTGLKRKIQQSVVYRRPVSLTEKSTGLGWKTRRRFIKPMAQKTGRSSNTYLGQIRFQTFIDQKRKGRTLHTNKRRHTQKGNNNYQPKCTQYQCTEFHQTYSEGPKAYTDSNTAIVGDLISPITNR
jgi:hypothetical protein